MNRKLALLIVLSQVVCLLGPSSAPALQNGPNGMVFPCASRGLLFTNLGAQPTNFDLGADWAGQCKLTFAWTDANGTYRTMSLSTPPPTAPATVSNSYLPSHGASGSLRAGASISWTTAAGSGSGVLNLTLKRPPSTLVPSSTTNVGSATFGNVGGRLGNGTSSNVGCGSGGVLYNNLTSAPINFDLMIDNESPGDQQSTTEYFCSITVYWKDSGGNHHQIGLTSGIGQGVLATTLAPGGVVAWTSSGFSGSLVIFYWQLERSVQIQGQTF